MIFRYMLKLLNFLIIQKVWFVLLYELLHSMFTKVKRLNTTNNLIFFVFLVSDPAMHRFILDRTATEYFSNLIWFMRTHILEFDNLIRNNQE